MEGPSVRYRFYRHFSKRWDPWCSGCEPAAETKQIGQGMAQVSTPMYCVNACTSHACFEEVYGSEPLEPGEVDFARWRTFTRCARKEVGKEHKRQREESYKSRYANHGKTKEGGN